MASDNANIRVFGSGSLWLAPAGTPLPAQTTGALSAALDAAFKDCGNLVEDSLAFAGTPEIFRVRSYGVARPTLVGKRLSSEIFNAAMQEWKTDNLKATFGGGSVTVANSIAKYVPPSDTTITDLSAVMKMAHGAKVFWIVIVSCKNLAGFTLNFRDNADAPLPLALEVQGGTSGVDPWYILSSDTTALSAG